MDGGEKKGRAEGEGGERQLEAKEWNLQWRARKGLDLFWPPRSSGCARRITKGVGEDAEGMKGKETQELTNRSTSSIRSSGGGGPFWDGSVESPRRLSRYEGSTVVDREMAVEGEGRKGTSSELFDSISKEASRSDLQPSLSPLLTFYHKDVGRSRRL